MAKGKGQCLEEEGKHPRHPLLTSATLIGHIGQRLHWLKGAWEIAVFQIDLDEFRGSICQVD